MSVHHQEMTVTLSHVLLGGGGGYAHPQHPFLGSAPVIIKCIKKREFIYGSIFFRILEVLLVGCVTTSVAFFSPIYLAYCKTLPQVLYVRQDEGLSAFFDCHVGSK